VHGPAIEAAKKGGKKLPPEVSEAVDAMRAEYEQQLDARYAAARGYVDAIVYPENTREMLSLALRASLHNPGPHLGPFVLPPHLGESS
jgi:3-methylcrotonyl-CoA carboxylase beta subunit